MAPPNESRNQTHLRRGAEHRPLGPIEAHFVAAGGEFVGTFLFLYFGYAGNLMAASRTPTIAPTGGMSSETAIFISIAYSFSLLVNVWAFYRISGGLFNPAVRLQLWLPMTPDNLQTAS
jgi:aquaporin related protein